MWEGLQVSGFQFDDSMEYALAKKEADIINYIIERMDISDPQVALKVYYKLLERQDLKTVVGHTFLKQLRDFCVQNGVADDESIRLISIKSDKKGKLASFGDENALEIDSAISDSTKDMDKGFEKLDTKISEEFSEKEKELKRNIQDLKSKESKFKAVADHYRNKVKRCYLVIAGLVIVIIVLFVMAISTGNTPFTDAEEDIQNRYAAWAEELSAKENYLTEREKALGEGEQ
ncbi:MAG: hypothetical protein IKW90_15550 [Lachnospiraceae bacterium]|nr:hypothetical protein [Lachnospiraceae bacterium]